MTAEPIAGKAVLGDNHRDAYEDGIGDTQLVIATQTVTTEDGTANNGLQQIVGETHTSEDAKVVEHIAHTLECIPSRDNSRDNHQEDDKVVNGFEPHFDGAKIDESQDDDNSGGYHEDFVPDLQVAPLVVEQSLSSQLHAENKEAEQLRQTSAKDIEAQIHLETVSQVGEGIFPERSMLMRTIDNSRDLVEAGMVDCIACQQTEQFHGLDGQQADDAPNRL